MNEKNFNINMKKITAVLCIIVAIASVFFFLHSKPNQKIKEIKLEIGFNESNIESTEKRIESLNAEIVDYNSAIDSLNTSLTPAEAAVKEASDKLSAAQGDLDTAESSLDKVCSRSYYSYYSCSRSCKSLHEAVDTQSELVDTAKSNVSKCQYEVTSIKNDIEDCEDAIKRAEADIIDAEERLEELKEERIKLGGKMVLAWVELLLSGLCILVAVAALGCIARCLFQNNLDKLVLFSCLGLAGVSAVFVLFALIGKTLSWFTFLVYPHIWNMVIMLCFCQILQKQECNKRKLRLFSVIAAVLLGAFGFLTGNILVAAWYAITMICLAFIIVPLDYTEYIPIYKHIFLSLITLGVWQLVWIYFVTKNLNKVSNVDKRNPSWELLMCMLLPFYYLYWLLKTAENTEAYGEENGKSFKVSALCIGFALVCPLFATVLIQNKINLIVGKPEEPEEPEYPAEPEYPTEPEVPEYPEETEE